MHGTRKTCTSPKTRERSKTPILIQNESKIELKVLKSDINVALLCIQQATTISNVQAVNVIDFLDALVTM